jgi:adenosylhomocysteine nucleosidase
MTRQIGIAIALALLAVAPGCQDAEVPEQAAKSYVVVMSAYPPELTRLRAEADVTETEVVVESTCYVGTLAGNDVILLLSGIGLERAAETTRAVLDSFDVTGIIFSGIAGGINPNLNIGDVTIPARWGHADGDLGPNDEGFWFPVNGAMFKVAKGVAGSVALIDSTPEGVRLTSEPRVITDGNGVSNSFFVDDPEYRNWLWTTFEANAVDMETAAVARVASERGVPYIAFRSLSDLAGGGPGANEIDTFFQLAADNAAAVVLAFLTAWAGPFDCK